MALFAREALNPGVRKRRLLCWAIHDFANAGKTTVVFEAVFRACFVVMAGTAVRSPLRRSS
jgi:UMF1 family MFS transporter